MRREKIPSYNLSFVFVDDAQIKKLNKEYLHRNRPTDVLAFELSIPLPPVKGKSFSKPLLTGEIFISTETAIRNAKYFRIPVKKEISLYLVHGILHLLGYNDHSSEEIAVMRQKEMDALNYLYP